MADLFLDAYAQKSPDFPEHRAAMFLAFSPLFWSLRSKLALPAGRLPFGYMLQNTITTLALLALAVVFLLRNSELIPPKPVAFYMSMCFILALSSIIRVGDYGMMRTPSAVCGWISANAPAFCWPCWCLVIIMLISITTS